MRPALFAPLLALTVLTVACTQADGVAVRPSATSVVPASSAPALTTTAPPATSTTTSTTTTTVPTTTVPPPPVAGPPIAFRALDSAGPDTYAALASGEVQLGAVYTTQAALADADLVVLTDDRLMQPAQHLIPFGRDAAFTPEVRAVLDAVSRALDTGDLVAMNARVAGGDPFVQVVSEYVTAAGLDAPSAAVDGTIVVGSPAFVEQQLVAAVYAGALTAAGADVTVRLDLPSREVVAAEITAGRLDVTVDYTGALLTYLGGVPTGNVYAVYRELAFRAASQGLTVGTPASATDTDGLAVRRDVAERYGLSSISDLARVTDPLVLGGPPSCPQLDTCIKGYQTVYGLQFVY